MPFYYQSSAADLSSLGGFLRRCRRLGYCEQSQPSIAKLLNDIDDIFFSRIMSNSKHILQQFSHDRTTTYSLSLSLWSRNHSKVLVNKTSHICHTLQSFICEFISCIQVVRGRLTDVTLVYYIHVLFTTHHLLPTHHLTSSSSHHSYFVLTSF